MSSLPFSLKVSKVTKSARVAIERNGGEVKEVFYSPLLLRKALRHPEQGLPPPQEYKV